MINEYYRNSQISEHFFLPVWSAILFQSPLSALFFLLRKNFCIFCSKTTIFMYFLLFFGFAVVSLSFRYPFYFFQKRSLFYKSFLREIFLRPLSALLLFWVEDVNSLEGTIKEIISLVTKVTVVTYILGEGFYIVTTF